MNLLDFREWCIQKHDVECNQKYDTRYPYSIHLRFVESHYYRFEYLLSPSWLDGPFNAKIVAHMGCWGHDVIEDARVTYNDIVELVGRDVANVIYRCTEEKGRNRDERHSEKYYLELAEDKIAIFVKLCDIMANVTYSIMTKSSMYKKHKAEHEKTMKYLYREDLKPMFDYLDKLFALW